MASPIIEKEFITEEGYHGVCIFQATGFRCGYVGISKDHGLYGVLDYDEVGDLVTVHGGITFAGTLLDFLSKDLWYFRFDCDHGFDSRDYASMQKYGFDLLLSVPRFKASRATIKTLEYVEKEVRKLSKQLTPASLMQAKMEN